MTYIHDRPDWPNLDWRSDRLATTLATVRHKQGRLLGKMESLGFDLQSEAGLQVMTREVVKSSAIEGEQLDADQVRSSIARRLGLDAAGLPRAGRNVDGVVDMMLDATRNIAAPISTLRLFEWHTLLFPAGRHGIRPMTVGEWRTKEAGPMQVASGPIGRETVHFEAPHADRLEEEMARFIEWFNAPNAIAPVLKAGIAHFWFVTIHPFDDGNGRIARAIADLALARADGTVERFYSMSSQIEAERNDYYCRLENSQRGGTDITEWILWFLECLERAIDGADDVLASVLTKARFRRAFGREQLNDRQRAVIERLLNGFEGNLTTSKYAKLARCSTDTALRDIVELVGRRILRRNSAGGRSTSYRLAEVDFTEDLG